MHNKTVIIICGPTAIGKTKLAIQIAKRLSTKIISADSRQCFKELNIGVAKPSINELNEVEHFFINTHSINETINAAYFENYALSKANEIFKTNSHVVMVGGTGLYIKAFCEGLDEIPEIPDEIRNKISSDYKLHGLNWLQNQIKIKDETYWLNAEQSNPQRLMRALEILEYTGKSILEYRKGKVQKRNFNIVKIGLEIPRDQLYQNINIRTEDMLVQGLVKEAEQLIPFANLNALQTVGYKELFEYFKGDYSLATATEKIKQHTRNYAKRQLTWFKKDKDIQWFNPSNLNEIFSFLNISTI